LKIGSGKMDVNLPALSACLLCFVPAISACSSKCIFVVATNSIYMTKQCRQYKPLISLFLNVMSVVITQAIGYLLFGVLPKKRFKNFLYSKNRNKDLFIS
jgi:hypothetical protein